MTLRTRLGFSAEPLYLMDGSAFVFRSFHAFKSMTRSDGFPTNVLHMVARLVLKLLREEKPLYLAFILDGKGPTFRHERFPAYKAQRQATPEALVQQIAPLRELLEMLGLPVLVSTGCEADDCIASLAARFRVTRPVVILGADKDLKQCLYDNVILWDPVAKNEKITTFEHFIEETGMRPFSWPDYQALVGDASDNIPGVPAIGPKTASDLIRKFPTLEELFDHLPAVPPKIRIKLTGQKENAFLYRELTRMRLDACATVEEPDLAMRSMRHDAVLTFMKKYELHSLAREVQSMQRAGFLNGAIPEAFSFPSTTMVAAKTPARFSGEKTAPEKKTVVAPRLDGEGSSRTPARATNTREQGNLFDPTTAPPPSFLREADIAALPLPEGGLQALPVLALLPYSGNAQGLLLAAENWERLFTGSAASLVDILLNAARNGLGPMLVVPDFKALYTAHPTFLRLPTSRCFDLSIAAYLLNPEDRGYSWEQVARRWSEQTDSDHRLDNAPGLLALTLHSLMEKRLEKSGLTSLFCSLEMPLVPVLKAMEQRGIIVDQKAFAAFLKEVGKDLHRLTARIHNLAGKIFNIRSSSQLSDVLFSELHLPGTGKTKGGAASTSQETLEKLSGKHPVIEAVLEFRKLEKLRSTYLEPLPKLVDRQGRIHTSFNQTATATGRLSSSSPNLQNIPVRGLLGRRMRACFTAAPGKNIVGADYSQIELRVLAHLSGDPTLVEAFRNNEDIHRRTASLLFDIPPESVSPEQRRNAKTINFGLVYGMGAQKLARELHIGTKEAKAFIERYFSRLSGLKEFYESVEKDAGNRGFVCSMAGRRRLTPDILSQNNQIRSQARRQAINARIQGSAADIIKIAMLAVENDEMLRNLEARLLLQIHDELLLEAPEGEARAAGERLAALMTDVKPGGEALCVPLLVEWGTGRTWADTH